MEILINFLLLVANIAAMGYNIYHSNKLLKIQSKEKEEEYAKNVSCWITKDDLIAIQNNNNIPISQVYVYNTSFKNKERNRINNIDKIEFLQPGITYIKQQLYDPMYLEHDRRAVGILFTDSKNNKWERDIDGELKRQTNNFWSKYHQSPDMLPTEKFIDISVAENIRKIDFYYNIESKIYHIENHSHYIFHEVILFTYSNKWNMKNISSINIYTPKIIKKLSPNNSYLEFKFAEDGGCSCGKEEPMGYAILQDASSNIWLCNEYGKVLVLSEQEFDEFLRNNNLLQPYNYENIEEKVLVP